MGGRLTLTVSYAVFQVQCLLFERTLASLAVPVSRITRRWREVRMAAENTPPYTSEMSVYHPEAV